MGRTRAGALLATRTIRGCRSMFERRSKSTDREPTREGPFPMETSYDWADTPEGGTLMTLRNRGEPSGFGKVSAPIMAAAMRRANRKDLARLKHILESSEE